MKLLLIVGIGLGAFLLVEGQTGSEGPRLGPEFANVRLIKNGKSDSRLDQVRVMTWNIDHGSDLARISEEMAGNRAGLCLLQEVDVDAKRSSGKDVAVELARRLHLNGAFAVEFEELSQEESRPAYIGQATLTELPIHSARVLRFERQSGFWRPRSWIPSSVPLLQRRLGSRIALVTELKFGGRLLAVYNAHLESRSAGSIQDRQLEEILEDAKRYPAGTAVLLGGDLNTKYLPSLFVHKLERADFRSVMGERIQRTHKVAMALDWLFVKGPIRFEGGSVRYDIKGSDHYPVYATLRTQ